MTFLTTSDILNSVLAKIADKSEAVTTRIASYVNSVCQTLANERDWKFLQIQAEIVLDADSIIAYPDDYGRVVEVIGDGFVLTKNDVVSHSGINKPQTGFKLVDVTTGLQIVPGTTGTVTLTYIPTIPAFEESDIALFPVEARPYIERAVLSDYYEYDDDPRWTTSVGLAAQLLTALKRWDTSLKPMPQYERQGMIR